MKKSIFIIVLCFILFFCNCFCTMQDAHINDTNNQLMGMDTNYKRVEYSKAIISIDNRIENTGTWDALFANKEFIGLYENSSYYIDSAIQFIANNKYTEHQKIVCIYSLQKSKLEDYIHFFLQCKNFFNNGGISEDILKKVISPTFGKRMPQTSRVCEI